MLRAMKNNPSESVARFRKQPHFVGLLLEDVGAESATAKMNSNTEGTKKSAHLEATKKIQGEIVLDKLTPAKPRTTNVETTAEEEERFAKEKKLDKNAKRNENKRAKEESEKAEVELVSRDAEYTAAELEKTK